MQPAGLLAFAGAVLLAAALVYHDTLMRELGILSVLVFINHPCPKMGAAAGFFL